MLKSALNPFASGLKWALNKYLNEYLENFDQDDIDFRFGDCKAVIKNAKLKTDLFNN